MPRVLLLTTGSVQDIKTWSGTSYHVYKELSRRYGDVVTVKESVFDRSLLFFRKVFNKVGWDLGREDFFSKVHNRILKKKITTLNPDIIVSVAASQKIARLDVSAPIVHVSDATFASMRAYYPRNFKSLRSRSLASGERMEQRVLTRAKAAMLSSVWAADSARGDYVVEPEKIIVAQFGANVTAHAGPVLDASNIRSSIELLFVGVEWERKGGPIAHALAQQIAAEGLPCRLHIVGCTPPDLVASDPSVICHGFLSKHDPADCEKLDRLFRMATFLVVPSRQEAYGLVFAEAAAYGLPVLATNTGGIPSVVEAGVTGYLIGLHEHADAYLQQVLFLHSHPEVYEKMRKASRARYDKHLTWEAWGEKFDDVLRRLVPAQTSV